MTGGPTDRRPDGGETFVFVVFGLIAVVVGGD
jgi:hypothetical protein